MIHVLHVLSDTLIVLRYEKSIASIDTTTVHTLSSSSDINSPTEQ
jgi:hypothetical protein